jgi:hypothetical protein
VHGKDHTTNTFLSPDISLLSVDLKMDHDDIRTRNELLGATLAFGVVVSEDEDPCAFADGQRDTERAASTRGRIAALVRAVAVNSHRTFCYAFVLMPERARLIRLDHSGIIYSELFSWRTSDHLANFLARFDVMSAAERGCDTSVATIASDCEAVLDAMNILALSDALPEGIPKSFVIPDDHQGTLSLMHVYDDEAKAFHRVVVHRAITSTEVYVGRCTLGYYGVDLDERAVVYVKDTWRIDSSRMVPEALTYRRLNKHKVSNLPGFYHGGDVPTDTPALIDDESVASSMQSTFASGWIKEHPEYRQRCKNGVKNQQHVHHRLLFHRIGRKLQSFKSTLQLCTALLHGLECTRIYSLSDVVFARLTCTRSP